MFLLEFDGNVEKHDGKYVKTLTVSVSLGGMIINQLRLLLQTFQYFSFFFVNLFIYFGLCWVFVAACGLSLVVSSGGYSSLRCAGFSLQWLLLLQSTGSRHVGFSSCGTRAQ